MKLEKSDKFNGVEIYRNISDIDFLDYLFKWSIEDVDIYEIKTYHTFMSILMTEKTRSILCTNDFKIIRKLNYKEMNIEKENSEIIFGFKNRYEKILNKILKFAKEDCYKSGFQLASLGIEKYLNELRKINKEGTVYGLLNLGRNEDLDKFIKSENTNILCEISDIGRPKDLDKLITIIDKHLIKSVLKNKRHKDIDKVIESNYLKDLVCISGVDKYLDMLIQSKYDYCIPTVIDGILRKKDLDIMLLKNRKNDIIVANYGFDNHLDYLSQHSDNTNVLESVLQFHRKCDYDRIKARGYEIDDDVCDENLLW